MPDERKTVTTLFADVVGSTAMGSQRDPELVCDVLRQFFARMKAIAESHGGTVEKYIGDAVMVVFGLPRLHGGPAGHFGSFSGRWLGSPTPKDAGVTAWSCGAERARSSR